MTNLIQTENKEINIKDNILQIVEYKGNRIITSYDIARLHNKEVRAVNQQFERNKERLREGVDYFTINKEDISESQSVIQNFIPNNVKEIKLFTERGYLKLVKSFTDDLSWEVQDLLVESYFRLKEILSTKQQCFLDIISAQDEVSTTLAIKKLDEIIIRPLEKELADAKPKVTYHDIVLSCTDLLTVTQIAQDYGISAQKLNKILEQEEIQYKDKTGVWLLRVKYGAQGYAQTQTHVYRDNNDVQHAKLHLKWTQKGRLFIYEILKTKGILPICEQE